MTEYNTPSGANPDNKRSSAASFVRHLVPDLKYILPLMSAGLYVFFFDLGVNPLQTWDEGFYANIARHMVQDGYWVVPHMYYTVGLSSSSFEPWLRLPPLGMWLQAISMILFGVNEFAVRFPSALASLLTAVVVYFLGRSYGSRETGFFAGTVFLSIPYVHSGFNAGREGGVDTLLLLFGTLFVYTVWLAVKHDNPHWLYLMGVFAGLAVLTKGFGAGVFVLVVLPFLFFNQSVFLSKEMAISTTFTLSIITPWPLYIYYLYDHMFVQQFFVRYIFERAAGPAFGENTNTLFAFMEYPYIKQLLFAPDFFHPWSFILIISLLVSITRLLKRDSQQNIETGLFIWWTVVCFGLFVFIGNKLWYIMPMLVPASVLIGQTIVSTIRGDRAEMVAFATGSLAVLIFSPSFSPFSGDIYRGLLFLLITISVLWAFPLLKQFDNSVSISQRRIISSILPLLLTIIIISSLVGAPLSSPGAIEQRELGLEVNESASPSEAVFIEQQMNVPFHTFSFYAQRPLQSGSISEFQSSGIQYAILRDESLSSINSDQTILMSTTVSGKKVSLIRVDR